MQLPFLLPAILLASLSLGRADTAARPVPKTSHDAGVPGLQQLQIGDPAREFFLPGIDGRNHTLADYRAALVLMIAFISNHCPDSQAAAGSKPSR